MNIGIIGGADGPTTIFVSSIAHRGLIIGAIIAVCGVVALLVVWRRSRRRA